MSVWSEKPCCIEINRTMDFPCVDEALRFSCQCELRLVETRESQDMEWSLA